MLSSVEQAFVGRDEKRAPLKTPACIGGYLERNLDLTLGWSFLVNGKQLCIKQISFLKLRIKRFKQQK